VPLDYQDHAWPDMAAVARIVDAIRGGPRGTLVDLAAAAEINRRAPESREQARAACEFHVRAALRAVADGGQWPSAKSVVFAEAGYPPSGWTGAALAHSAAAIAVPSARFLYCTADGAIALLWQRTLAGEPRALACQAPAVEPAQVAGMARAAGLLAPWSVQLQMCVHWWSARQAEKVIAGYAAQMPPGSTLVLSVAVPGGVDTRGELGRLAGGPVGAVPYAHSKEAIAGWIAAAGLVLDPEGVTDVRRLPGRTWAGEALGEHLAGHVVGATGLKPLAGGGQPQSRRARGGGLLG
jgi:hypothetical protein